MSLTLILTNYVLVLTDNIAIDFVIKAKWQNLWSVLNLINLGVYRLELAQKVYLKSYKLLKLPWLPEIDHGNYQYCFKIPFKSS